MTPGEDALFSEAVRLHHARDFSAAAASYREFLARHPTHVSGLSNLADVLRQLGQYEDAAVLCRRAITLDPKFAPAHANLGVVLLDQRDHAAAADALAQAIDLGQRAAPVYFAHARALSRAGRWNEAITSCSSGLAQKPDAFAAWVELGVALHALDRYDEAMAALRRALEINPQCGEAMSNLGNTLVRVGQIDEAVAMHRRAVELTPRSADAFANLGSALHRQLQFEQSLAASRHAVALNPRSVLAHQNLAGVLLAMGDYTSGWVEHEWRLVRRPHQAYPRPRWDGADLAGRTILVHTEQGYGDTIQFSRYLPLIAKRGGRIILACQPALTNLMARIDGVDKVITFGQKLAKFDCHLPLMSAPLVFSTTVQTIPTHVPYLRVDAQKADRFRARLHRLGDGLKIGLAWTGNRLPDPGRTIPGSLLAPLGGVPGVHWISLQKDPDRNPAPGSLHLVDWTSELHDFDDTAALACAVDRVVSIESAMAHLGGALARPTHVLLPHACGWRWLRDRTDSPWYPTATLIRQAAPGDWAPVIERLVADIRG